MLVAAIDPGLLTGVCFVRFDTPEGCVLEASQEIEFGQIESWAGAYFPRADRIVVERFIINKKTISNSQAPWSLEAIGAFRLMAHRYSRELEFQSAADAKSTVDNTMIRRLGLWHRGGKGHALDAIRHAVTFAIRKGWRDPRLLPSDA